jgi:nucleotide-binding universal stress UspA family protein
LPDSEKDTDAILVAVDGSLAARSAAEVAIQIARSQDLLVRGLYVVDEVPILNPYADFHAELDSTDEPTTQAELVSLFEEQGHDALEWLEDRCSAAGVWVAVDMMAGGVSDMIRNETSAARLLALGRRGHAHAGDPTHLGTNFRTIAHDVQLPMLAGGDDETRPVQRLLLAYNGSEYAQQALDWASRLQNSLSAETIVLAVQEHDGDPTEQWVQEAATRLKDGISESATRSGQPAAQIVAAAGEYDVDLIVMGRYRHGAVVERLLGSTVDHVLRSASLSVLIT